MCAPSQCVHARSSWRTSYFRRPLHLTSIPCSVPRSVPRSCFHSCPRNRDKKNWHHMKLIMFEVNCTPFNLAYAKSVKRAIVVCLLGVMKNFVVSSFTNALLLVKTCENEWDVRCEVFPAYLRMTTQLLHSIKPSCTESSFLWGLNGHSCCSLMSL